MPERRDEILKALGRVQDPDLHRDLVSLGDLVRAVAEDW